MLSDNNVPEQFFESVFGLFYSMCKYFTPRPCFSLDTSLTLITLRIKTILASF